MRVGVKNIQAVEEASIEIEGFTGIVGKSNFGKSAFIRGLYAALTNKAPKSIFRYNTKESQVNIDDDERDIHIEWRRGDSINQYEINGKKHTKVGKEPPAEVPAWGFQSVKIGDENLEVQFAKQHQYLFLLDKSGGFVADFISKITKADILTGAVKDCETDGRKVNDTIKHTDKEITKLTEDLTRFVDLDFYQTRIKAFIEEKAALVKKQEEINSLEKIIKELDSLLTESKKLEFLPDVTEVQFDLPELIKVSEFIRDAQALKERYLAVKKIDELPLPEIDFDVVGLKDVEACLALQDKCDFETPEIPSFDCDFSGLGDLDQMILEFTSASSDSAKIEKELKETTEIADRHLAVKLKFEQDEGQCPVCKSDFKEGSHLPHSIEKEFTL